MIKMDCFYLIALKGSWLPAILIPERERTSVVFDILSNIYTKTFSEVTSDTWSPSIFSLLKLLVVSVI